MDCIKKDSQGHRAGYTHSGCRCDLCKAANSEYKKSPKVKAQELAKRNTPKDKARVADKNAAFRKSPKGRAYYKAYWKTPEGKAVQSVSWSKRRAAKLHSFADLTDHERKLLYMIFKVRPFGYEVDHIHPLSKGGLDTPMNLQYLSVFDNRSKNNKLDYVPKDRVLQWFELIDPLTGEPRV